MNTDPNVAGLGFTLAIFTYFVSSLHGEMTSNPQSEINKSVRVLRESLSEACNATSFDYYVDPHLFAELQAAAERGLIYGSYPPGYDSNQYYLAHTYLPGHMNQGGLYQNIYYESPEYSVERKLDPTVLDSEYRPTVDQATDAISQLSITATSLEKYIKKEGRKPSFIRRSSRSAQLKQRRPPNSSVKKSSPNSKSSRVAYTKRTIYKKLTSESGIEKAVARFAALTVA